MMLLKEDKFIHMERENEETIYREITQYLKTCQSKYFEFDSKEPREEVILRVFDQSTLEYFKNKLRRAVYIALEREDLFLNGFDYISRLLVLAEEMKVTEAKNILLDLARANDFPGISPENKSRLKNHIISILLKFDITEEALKEIIENNIFDPDYTDICLTASTRLIPRFDSFVKYFPIAFKQYLAYPQKICLDSVLRVCLDKIGKVEWRVKGDRLLLCDFNHMSEIQKLFETAEIGLSLHPVNGEESSFEFEIRWPFDEEIVSAFLFDLTDSEQEILQKALIKKRSTSLILKSDIETDITLFNPDDWIKSFEVVLNIAEDESNDVPINFTYHNHPITV